MKSIEIPTKREPPRVEILLPPPVVQGANNEMESDRSTFYVLIVTLVEMLLGSGVIVFLFWMAGGPTYGLLFSLVFSYWLWHINSTDSKLIISGDYAAVEEIGARYDLLEQIVEQNYELACKQFELDWQEMLQRGQLQLTQAQQEQRLIEAQADASHWRRRASEYDMHRQHAWQVEAEDNLPILFETWLAEVYANQDEPIIQPWSKSGPWSEESKQRTKNEVLPRIERVAAPLFIIGKHTGHKPLFDFDTYPTFNQAVQFMEEIWK